MLPPAPWISFTSSLRKSPAVVCPQYVGAEDTPLRIAGPEKRRAEPSSPDACHTLTRTRPCAEIWQLSPDWHAQRTNAHGLAAEVFA